MDNVQERPVDELLAKVQVNISKIEGGLQRLEGSMQEDTREAASATLAAPTQRKNSETGKKERQGRVPQKSLNELRRDLNAPVLEAADPLTARIRAVCDIHLALDRSVVVKINKTQGGREVYYTEDRKEDVSYEEEAVWFSVNLNGKSVGIVKFGGILINQPIIQEVVTLPQYQDAVTALAGQYTKSGRFGAHNFCSDGPEGRDTTYIDGLNGLGQRKLKEIYTAQQQVEKALIAQPLVESLIRNPESQKQLSALCQEFLRSRQQEAGEDGIKVRSNTFRVFAISLDHKSEQERPLNVRHEFPIGVVEYTDDSYSYGTISHYQTLPGFEEAFMAYLSATNPSNSRKDLFKDLHARAEEQAQAKRFSLFLKQQRRMQQRGQEATL